MNAKTPKNCITCSFQYPCNKGKTYYCALKRFPILNPEIGCPRHISKAEYKVNKQWLTAEEISALSRR